MQKKKLAVETGNEAKLDLPSGHIIVCTVYGTLCVCSSTVPGLGFQYIVHLLEVGTC